MNDESHTIRLAGPWDASFSVKGGESVASARVVVRTPADWTSWLGTHPTRGVLRIERSFNWVFPDPPPQVVELHICGLSQRLDAAELNGVRLKIPDSEYDPRESVFAITGLLTNSNRLALEFDLAGHDPTKALLNTVFLSITGP